MQYTVKFKNVGAWWSEVDLSALAQITLFADPKTGNVDPSWYELNVQSLVAGGQAAWVIPLFTNKVQLQAVVQGVLGQARDVRAGADGKLVVRDVVGRGPAMGQIRGSAPDRHPTVGQRPGAVLHRDAGIAHPSIRRHALDGTPILGGIQIPLNLP